MRPARRRSSGLSAPSSPLVGGLPRREDTDQRSAFKGIVRAAYGGGDEETRTPDPLLAKEMLYQLSYVPEERHDSVLITIWRMVGVSGLEPETSALSGQCSNQLS